jgi:hypothetical protein
MYPLTCQPLLASLAAEEIPTGPAPTTTTRVRDAKHLLRRSPSGGVGTARLPAQLPHPQRPGVKLEYLGHREGLGVALFTDLRRWNRLDSYDNLRCLNRSFVSSLRKAFRKAFGYILRLIKFHFVADIVADIFEERFFEIFVLENTSF